MQVPLKLMEKKKKALKLSQGKQSKSDTGKKGRGKVYFFPIYIQISPTTHFCLWLYVPALILRHSII